MPRFLRWTRAVLVLGIFVSLLVVLSPGSVSAGGYVLSIDDLKKMNAQVIDFEDISKDPLTSYWDSLGVKFSSNNGKAIFINTYNRGGAATASGVYSLMNDAAYPNTSVNDPLKITFKNGADVVAFYLGNGKGTVKATIKSYNQVGKLVHEVSNDPVPDAVTRFISLTYIEPIYTVTIDYGNTLYSEVIDDLIWISTGAKVSCSDTDGINYDVFGSILGRDENTSAPFSYFDQCANGVGDNNSLEEGLYVMEYNCAGTSDKPYVHKQWYKCANGCVFGACKSAPAPVTPVTPAVVVTCSDTDNGVNNDVFGSVLGNDEISGVNGTYNDSCGAFVGDLGKTAGAYVAEKHCSGTSLKPYVHTQWYKCENGCDSGKCVAKVDINAQCNATCKQQSGTEGVCGGTEGEMIGTKYCALQSQCVCKPAACTADSQCKATNGSFKCISGKCGYPDCNTACKVDYGYSGGSCDATSGKEVGSAFCGQTYKQCRCIVSPPTTQNCYDSDGGPMFNVFGYSYGADEGSAKIDNYFDSCGASIGDQGKASGDYLAEKYCSGPSDKPYVHTQWSKCENGCQSGACKKVEAKPIATIDVGLYGFVKIGQYNKQVKWGETITLTPEDAVVANGKQTSVFSLFYSSKNYGDKDSGVFKNGIYVDGVLATTPGNNSLSKNDIQNFDYLVNLKEKTGTHAIKISIDSNNKIVESSESNNSGTIFVKLEGFDDPNYDLDVKPIITRPYSDEVLTNYPRRATIIWTAIKNAKSYEIEVTCDLCGASSWISKYYFNSKINTLLTEALPGDNQFRVTVRAIFKDGTKGTWSDFVYFRYKTAAVKKTICQNQRGSDGVYTICIGKNLVHDSGLKAMVSKQNTSYVWVKITWKNSSSSKIYKIKKGSTKSFDQPNSDTMVDITYLKYGGSKGAVLRLETDLGNDDGFFSDTTPTIY